MAYSSRALIGVSGWLAFLVLSLWISAALSILQLIGLLARLGGAGRPVTAGAGAAYLTLAALAMLCRVGALGYSAWSLSARQTARTPPLVTKLLWLNALAPALVDVLASSVLLGLPARLAGQALGTELFRPVIYAAFWTVYLRRSERVSNTYTGSGADDHLAAVFN